LAGQNPVTGVSYDLTNFKTTVTYGSAASDVVTLEAPKSHEPLEYHGRVVDLLESLDHRWKTKKKLSELSGIPIGSIKVYFLRLRREFNRKRRSAGVSSWGKSVFQSRKINGVWVYRLMASLVKV